MKKVYLETSFVSACVTTRTDHFSQYRRAQSVKWWTRRRGEYEVFVSEEVEKELSHPDYPLRTAALALLQGVPRVAIDADVIGFAQVLVDNLVVPRPARAGDAIHVACACVHRLEFVLSWNVKHLANLNKLEHLRKVCLRSGLSAPMIVTPDLILGTDE